MFTWRRLATGVLAVAALGMTGCVVPSVDMPPQPQGIVTQAPGPALQRPLTEEEATQVARIGQPAPSQIPAASVHATALLTYTTEDFTGAGICATCHQPLPDANDVDIAMPTHWRSTMMANAARDPVWNAKVSSEVERNPGLQAVIEKKCTTCHMPIAETQAGVDGGKIAMLGDGFLNPANPLHDAAMEGVACTLCHQVRSDGFGEKTSFSGGYVIDTNTDAPDRPIFGPFQTPIGDLMQASTGFIPEYGAQMAKPEHCATCHNLYTPYVDAAGTVLGEFPEQTPYTEWQHSSYGAAGTACQSCHMPTADSGMIIATTPPDLTARQPFFQHYFAGGNAFMVSILEDHGAELGVTADPEQFDATRQRVEDQLGKRSATLKLTDLTRDGDDLVAALQVNVMTGHKFPASFPSRRAWIHITVTDAAGKLVFESGAPQPDGSIAGCDADADTGAYEPHYDLIARPDQVQIYEPIMGDTDGNVTYTLLRGAVYLKDNRLLPTGFDKAAAPPDIAVHGDAIQDANFIGGGDEIIYRITTAGYAAPFTVQAELLYEPLSYRFVQDLLEDDTDLVSRFGGYYETADKTPMLVSSIEKATLD
jgi:hypothetical protein